MKTSIYYFTILFTILTVGCQCNGKKSIVPPTVGAAGTGGQVDDDDEYHFLKSLELSHEEFIFHFSPESIRCKDLWKLKKKNRCKTQKKSDYIKDVARRFGGGGLKVNNGVIQFVLPEYRAIKTETDKLNLIIATYHQEKERWCNQANRCNTIQYLVWCREEQGKDIPKNMQKSFDRCEVTLKASSMEDLTTAILKLDTILSEFNSTKLNEKAVTAAMQGELAALELDKTESDTTSTMKADTTNSKKDTIIAPIDTLKTDTLKTDTVRNN